MEEKKEERSKSHNLQNYTEEGVHTENSKRKKKAIHVPLSKLHSLI